jgi:hypothetical protein
VDWVESAEVIDKRSQSGRQLIAQQNGFQDIAKILQTDDRVCRAIIAQFELSS